jgi:predicted nucleic acid-binding protein
MRKTDTQMQIFSLMKETPYRPAIPYMAYYEYFYGIVDEKNLDVSIQFLNTFHFLPPTKRTAILHATMRRKLEKQGVHVPMPDLLIACQAIEHQMTVITKDKLFGKIPGLSAHIMD